MNFCLTLSVLSSIFLVVTGALHAELAKTELSKASGVGPALVTKINGMKTSFTAANYPRFASKTKAQLNRFLGARVPPPMSAAEAEKNAQLLESSIREKRQVVLDANYDARAYTQCTSIGKISDQSNCGDCWAVSTADAITDRACIFYGDKKLYSAWDLTSCCRNCLGDGVNGCNGGYTEYAADFYISNGLVSGGAYGSNVGCKPFPIVPNSGGAVPTSTPCKQSCRAGYTVAYASDRRKSGYFQKVVISNNVTAIQYHIRGYGPLVAQFDVYADFYNYRSGIYTHVSGGYVGSHAVRVIGWGVSGGVPYWLAANSWGTSWGEKGFFRIRRGYNDVGFESHVVAVYA